MWVSKAEFLENVKVGDRPDYDMNLAIKGGITYLKKGTKIRVVDPLKEGARIVVLTGEFKEETGYMRSADLHVDGP